ncbi:monovalent cation/H(+) antiporter subunit G [Brachybacterium hainanense]|uniref:Monovalent cation/H(+) antiporter subunit G n=1 Tax=Brachybacterium hainanense TaxID=1541174 RepID=A0ABV6RC70_9MICO
MSALDVIGLVLIGLGVLLAMIAAVGLHRFRDALMRMHATSKPQTLGLMLVLAGTALLGRSWAGAGFLLLVLLAQMVTVPVASTMVGRAAFRRGFVRGGQYAVDELSPRLAASDDVDDDEDGFLDEYVDEARGVTVRDEDRFPENTVVPAPTAEDLSTIANWDEPEPEERVEDEDDRGIDIDIEDETELEAEHLAEER